MYRTLSATCNLSRKLNHYLHTSNIIRHNVIPNSVPINEKSTESEQLRNLRLAITPSYGYGSNSYDGGNSPVYSSTLAGDPRHVQMRQDIRKEVLEKWKRPKPDSQREWLKNLMFI
ncbi:uncharacterized protein LOC111360025 [Spodoptera litura]|uniref:Uncharacterized protein LOC111360025 n=1 Tax=Spodoptera litura TaxID=69820 RepID=A0A9J7IWV0_SPOLT|nr:uncharacterized protein LOC111360025 [Spodoptera litura]